MKSAKVSRKKAVRVHTKKAHGSAAKKRSPSAKKSAASRAKKTHHMGQIYVVAKTGTRTRKVHVAKKATAAQIKHALGISANRISNVSSMIRSLEDKGLIRRVN